ncbi:MAG: glycosyltransferase family 39 protein [Candidatus Omnitrophota bacterium]
MKRSLRGSAIILVFILLAAVYLAGASNQPPRSDGSTYVLLARSLASGHGYREFPIREQPHTKYPFLLPALFSVFQRFAPESFYLLDILSALLTLGSAYFVYVLLKGYFSRNTALILTTLIALNPYTFVQYSHRATSEALFTFTSLAAVLCIEKYAAVKNRASLAASIAALTAACYSRQVGIILLFSAVMYFIFLKNRRGALLVGGITAVLILPWWSRVLLLVYYYGITPDISFITNLPGLARLSKFTLSVFVHASAWTHWVVFPTFFVFFRFVRGEAMALGSALGNIKFVLTLAVALCTALGFFRHVKRRWRIFDFYVVFYGLGICAAGNYMSYRLLYPIVPFLFYYLVTGTNDILNRVSDLSGRGRRPGAASWAKPLKVVLIGVLFCSSILHIVHQTYGERTGRFTRPWNAYFDAARWAKENLPDDTVIMCYKAQNFYLVSGKHSVDVPYYYHLDKLSDFFDALRILDADYLVLTDPGFPWGDAFRKTITPDFADLHSGAFTPVKTIQRYGGKAIIYRIHT